MSEKFTPVKMISEETAKKIANAAIEITDNEHLEFLKLARKVGADLDKVIEVLEQRKQEREK